MTPEEYLNQKTNPHRIGFTQEFPIVKYLKFETVTKKCRNFTVTFDVNLVKVSFGGKYTCTAIVTDCVDISHNLFMNGWNSCCFVDEAETMEKALVEFAEKNGFELCTKVNSWPFAKAIVQRKNHKLYTNKNLFKKNSEYLRTFNSNYRDSWRMERGFLVEQV